MNWRLFPAIATILVAASLFSFPNMELTSAQTMPGMTQVSGEYNNDELGISITFPDGWEGFELETGGALSVTTIKGGIDAEIIQSIGLMVAEKGGDTDPTDPSTYAQDPSVECGESTIGSVQVSGKTGMVVTTDCTQDGEAYTFKAVTIQTETHWVMALYMSPSSAYSAEEATFDSTVDTLQVEGAMDVESTGDQPAPSQDPIPGIELRVVTQSVVVAGETIDLDVRTSSTISNFMVQEENMMVSFTVDGPTGTEGSTEVSIGRVLEGPYTVMIDGESTTNFEVANEGTTDAVITISYTHSAHDIEITGTRVVPEFPAIMVGIIAAVMGVIVIIGRTNLVRLK